MDITTLGIDLAKNVFQLHGIDSAGKVLLKKKLSRTKLVEFIANLPPCLIGIEACGGAHYWARKFQALGHTVKMMSPQFVKPYVKGNKNDERDAEAICEAVTRPNMRFVPIKEIEQQDALLLHRVRAQLIQNRTALVNQIRGLLSEYGIVFAAQIQNVRTRLPEIIDDFENGLSEYGRMIFKGLYADLVAIDERIKSCDMQMALTFKSDERCQRIGKIEGIGVISATAIVAAMGDPSLFKNGREFAAWLGLVPRQSSSGGKQVLLGISKRGDRYLRTLLIHGARAAICRGTDKKNRRGEWIQQIKERRGVNKACVALANKNARIIWAILAKNEAYRVAA
jgi:transposase